MEFFYAKGNESNNSKINLYIISCVFIIHMH